MGQKLHSWKQPITGEPATIRLLLAHGADPAIRNTINNQTALEIAKDAAKGPNLDVIKHLENEKLFDDMNLPPDQLEKLKQAMEGFDLKQSYIDSSNEIAKTVIMPRSFAF